jgi:hypothetical protein
MEKLEALTADAEERQAVEIAAAIATALQRVPPGLRGITRKLLGA